MFIFSSAADVVISGSLLIVFNVLTLKVAMLTMFCIHIILVRVLLMIFRALGPELQPKKKKKKKKKASFVYPYELQCSLERIVWIHVMIIFINRRYPYRWVGVASLLNFLILAVDQWGSSAQHLVKHAVYSFRFIRLISHATCGTPWFPLLYAPNTETVIQWQDRTWYLNFSSPLWTEFYCQKVIDL